jgi:hypothetical protein
MLTRKLTKVCVATLVSLAATLAVGCTDVGDNTANPGDDAGNGIDATSAGDATQASDDGGGDDGGQPATGSGPDATPGSTSDDGASPGEPDDTGVPNVEDSGATEAGTPEEEEAGMDAATVDAGGLDATIEAGPIDAGVVEAGAAEAGTVDAGLHDAGEDATVVEAGTPDAGTPDTGAGGGHDAGIVPCTAMGQTGCVKCPANTADNGVCTPTEALIVEHDIAKGYLDSTGQLLPFQMGIPVVQGSCYSCLNANACLDDNVSDTGNECSDTGDLAGQAAGSGVQLCLDTLSCILSTDCQGAGGTAGTSAAAPNINLCYCGGNNAGSVCKTAGAAVNGLCVAKEVAGFGYAQSDNTDILNDYVNLALPSGEANAIFACGVSNKCTLCQ